MFCRLTNQIKAGKKGTSHQKCETSLCGAGLVDPVRINSKKTKTSDGSVSLKSTRSHFVFPFNLDWNILLPCFWFYMSALESLVLLRHMTLFSGGGDSPLCSSQMITTTFGFICRLDHLILGYIGLSFGWPLASKWGESCVNDNNKQATWPLRTFADIILHPFMWLPTRSPQMWLTYLL